MRKPHALIQVSMVGIIAIGVVIFLARKEVQGDVIAGLDSTKVSADTGRTSIRFDSLGWKDRFVTPTKTFKTFQKAVLSDNYQLAYSCFSKVSRGKFEDFKRSAERATSQDKELWTNLLVITERITGDRATLRTDAKSPDRREIRLIKEEHGWKIQP